MQNSLISFGKEISLTTYPKGKHLVQQTKKVKNNINCVKFTDDAVNL